jgi:mannose-6-phosphate isomerase-like protein (cupin superfamily)
MKPVLVFAVLMLCAGAFGQEKKAEVFSASDIKAKLATGEQAARVSGSGGGKLGDYGTHSIGLSVRDTSGGAEVHAHFDDIFYVTGGHAMLITGGTVADAKTGPDGETHGSKVEGGTTQTIAEGDVVHIPAGVPHQIIVEPGVTYSAVVVKVKEQ